MRSDKAMECNRDPLFPLEAPILPISLSPMLKKKDYEFLHVDPNRPLSHHIIYRGMKSQLQERVRYNRCQEETRRNAQNRASNLHGRATYTGGSRNMCRAMEQLKCQIIKDGGTPILLKLYLGTHSSSRHQ
ncbi:uncharacterized protein A4U43_C10F10400 [Asparagus officinalis]|uniref:Uncharacterized protein n=1 Tax=Asparagus officinalis TaxID=4686 RepID=A0A5P1E6G3_ASPOF|nr:uncharacterized protein A4U43_C10F10400 [Asparagus officinalis]